MLQQTRELLGEAGAEDLDRALAACMAQAPLMKPGDHKGGPATDMFDVGLPSDDIRAVLAVVSDAFDHGQTTTGTQGRGLGGFVEAWAECLSSVEANN
jgi:hypothetical protein